MENHGTDPRTRGELLNQRVRAMIEIWTKDEAEFHSQYVGRKGRTGNRVMVHPASLKTWRHTHS